MSAKYKILDSASNILLKSLQDLDALIIFYNKNKLLIPSNKIFDDLRNDIQKQIEIHKFIGNENKYLEIISGKKNKYLKIILIGCSDLKNRKSIESLACWSVRKTISLGYINFGIFTSLNIKKINNYQSFLSRGSLWGTYKYSFNNKNDESICINFISNKKHLLLIKEGIIEGETICNIADLSNSPGNIATPSMISQYAEKISSETNLDTTILKKIDLEEKKCGGILSVADGSKHEPEMIIMKHLPRDKKTNPIVLVGKTVTFDSGGISLKPGKDMGWMKYDKCGGMTVLCIMEIISKLKLNLPVIGILGIAENMPGSNATRPGDIISAYNKKTIEILNTDAEGRLILADALGIASEFKPSCIIDIATLTGAVIMALGHSASAVLGNNNNLINSLILSGNTVGEKLWELPILEDFLDDMKSDFADLSNLSKSGTAGTATAAAFLSEFIPKNIPWAHLDIAGTAWKNHKTDYQDSGATLFSVRLLLEWIKNYNK